MMSSKRSSTEAWTRQWRKRSRYLKYYSVNNANISVNTHGSSPQPAPAQHCYDNHEGKTLSGTFGLVVTILKTVHILRFATQSLRTFKRHEQSREFPRLDTDKRHWRETV